MSEENVEVARGGYEDFNSGNIPGALARYDENIEWIEPGGGNAPSGTFNGRDSVGEDIFATVPENFDEFRAEPEEFRDEGDTVVVTGRFRGKAKRRRARRELRARVRIPRRQGDAVREQARRRGLGQRRADAEPASRPLWPRPAAGVGRRGR